MKYPRTQEAKAVVLGFANVVVGLLDVLDGFSKGQPTELVVKRAVRNARTRSEALSWVEKRHGRLDEREDG